MKTNLSLDYAAILANTARPIHLALTFDAPTTTPSRPQPVAFVVVLDQSGSMSGHPLEAAKRAAESVVRNLRPGDWFGMVTFDSTAQTIISFSDQRDPAGALRAIGEIQEGSSTNLTAGWSLGRDMLAKAPKGCPRKLLLLTDGQANVGITEPDHIQHLVGQALERENIRTSCLGFGDDYSEDLLRSLATVTGGELHDANSPENLPKIFEIELEGLQRIAVQNLRVRLKPAPCVDDINLLGAYPAPSTEIDVREYAIGDLVSSEQRVIIFALSVLPIPMLPDGQVAATWEGEKLLDLEILCDVISDTGVEIRRESHVVAVQPVQDPAEVKVNVEVIAWVSLQVATEVVDRAVKLRDLDQPAEARILLEQELERLATLPPSDLLVDAAKLIRRALALLDENVNYSRERKSMYSMSLQYSKGSSHQSTLVEDGDIPSFKRRRPPSPNQPSSPPSIGKDDTI